MNLNASWESPMNLTDFKRRAIHLGLKRKINTEDLDIMMILMGSKESIDGRISSIQQKDLKESADLRRGIRRLVKWANGEGASKLRM